MFLFAFGGGWLCLWAFLAFTSPWPVAVAIAIVTLGLLIVARRVYVANAAAGQETEETPDARRRSRLFNIVNIGQWVAILVVANVLMNVGQSRWVIPAVIFIVGLHFIPLARLFANPPHYFTGIALMMLATGYPLISPTGPGSPVGCLMAGLILWASAAWAVAPHSSPVQVPTVP